MRQQRQSGPVGFEALESRSLFSVGVPAVPAPDAAATAQSVAAFAGKQVGNTVAFANGTVQDTAAFAVQTAKDAVPQAVPDALANAAQVEVTVGVETDVPLIRQLSPAATTGALNGVVPPISADALSAPADFAALGLSSLNGVVPPIASSAVARPIDFSQIDTDQPQRIGGTIGGPYPLDVKDLYVGYVEVPHSDTGVGLNNNGLTSGDVGLTADAIEADLGGAGLEV